MSKQTITKHVEQFYWENERISDVILNLKEAQAQWATTIEFESDEGNNTVRIYTLWEFTESDEEWKKRLQKEYDIDKLVEEYERRQLKALKAKYES